MIVSRSFLTPQPLFLRGTRKKPRRNTRKTMKKRAIRENVVGGYPIGNANGRLHMAEFYEKQQREAEEALLAKARSQK